MNPVPMQDAVKAIEAEANSGRLLELADLAKTLAFDRLREATAKEANEDWKRWLRNEAPSSFFIRDDRLEFELCASSNGEALFVLDVEAMMREEVESDPLFAVELAAHFRRLAALADGIDVEAEARKLGVTSAAVQGPTETRDESAAQRGGPVHHG